MPIREKNSSGSEAHRAHCSENMRNHLNIASRVNFHDHFGLFKHTSIMFAASLITGTCNYIYQIYMGKALGPESYGVFGSLFAIFYIVSVCGGTIQTSIARFVSKLKAEGEYGNIGFLLYGMLKRMSILGIVMFLIFTFAGKYIASFLKIESNELIIIVGIILFLSFFLPIGTGALQGMERFWYLGTINILNASSKLIFGIFLVCMGFGVAGALGGVAIAIFLALIAAFIPNIPVLKHKGSEFDFFQLYKYAFPVIIAVFCYTVPANIDVIMVKHFFDEYDAGIYTATSVLGKIVFFIPGAVSAVMFPKVSGMHTQKKRTFSLLNMCLIIACSLSGPVALAYLLTPSLIVNFIFGPKYMEATSLVGIYGLTMFFFTLFVIVSSYNLAIHNLKYVLIPVSFMFLLIFLLSIFHETMREMVMTMLYVSAILFFLSYFYTAWRERKMPLVGMEQISIN